MLWPLGTYFILLGLTGVIFFLPQRRHRVTTWPPGERLAVVQGRHFRYWTLLFLIFAFLFWPLILLFAINLTLDGEFRPGNDLATMLMANGPLVLAYGALLLMRSSSKR
jgi:hypothetical protein